MVHRCLTATLVAGVVLWLGILIAAPSPMKSARQEAAAVDCAVICLDTQPITWQTAPPEPMPLARSWPRPETI